MLDLQFSKKTIRGTFANQLLRLVSKFPDIKKHHPVNFGRLYTTELTDTFRFPKNIVANQIEFHTAKMEWIYKSNNIGKNIILQFHGGAYVSGYSDIYRKSALKYLSLTCSCSVLSLDYRLAPIHPFPAAFEDAIAAYDFVISKGYLSENIILVGDSAGGGLVLALGLYLRDQQRVLPKAIITMSAWTDLAAEGESYLRNIKLDPLLGENTDPLDVKGYIGHEDIHNPYISPVYGQYHNYTNLMMHVGSNEVLESDTLSVAKIASDAGNNVKVTIYRGMFHVFQLAFGLIPEAKKAWKEIGKYIETQFTCNLER
ncbi:MAG: alpha/beta hydrolase [Firmicutes bacterium]|nr:alpha/beta hydrolase [Bacillota bacterium]